MAVEKAEDKVKQENDDDPSGLKEVKTTGNDKLEGDTKPPEDMTLLLSAEEEAEVAAETNEDAVKTAPPKNVKTKPPQKNVWVSNISRGTKAADLKKLFSEKFKVDSAKIMTNGKSYFGYICLETSDMAEQSVKELNNAVCGGRKVTVSLSRPDIRSGTKSNASERRPRDNRKETRVTNGVKIIEEGKEKKETSDKSKDTKDKSEDKKSHDPKDEELQDLRRRDKRNFRLLQELRTEINQLKAELQNNRRRLNDSTRRLDEERERKTTMRREIETLEAQLKTERRRYTQELEHLEKKNKMEELRTQDDRAMLNKELEECRKLREFLQRKIDDVGVSNRHSRGSPHRSAPDRSDKISRGRLDNRSARSPPPPPKINSRRMSRERSPAPYKNIKKSRIDVGDSRPARYSSYSSSSASFSGGNQAPLLGHYPPSSGPSGGPSRAGDLYGSSSTSSYQDSSHRYGGYNAGGFSNITTPSSSLMSSRSVGGYPDIRGNNSTSQRKY